MNTSRRNFLQIMGSAFFVSRFGTGCSHEANVKYALTCERLSTTVGGMKVKRRSYHGT